MPNWCSGVMNVWGTVGSIRRFLKRFAEWGGEDRPLQRRFFPRSFITDDYVFEELDEYSNDEETGVQVSVEFAWSGYSCLVEGYPQNDPVSFITLGEACNEDGIDHVAIYTIEPSVGFVEMITYKHGVVNAQCLGD